MHYLMRFRFDRKAFGYKTVDFFTDFWLRWYCYCTIAVVDISLGSFDFRIIYTVLLFNVFIRFISNLVFFLLSVQFELCRSQNKWNTIVNTQKRKLWNVKVIPPNITLFELAWWVSKLSNMVRSIQANTFFFELENDSVEKNNLIFLEDKNIQSNFHNI